LEIKENGKFVFNSPDGVSNLVEGTRTTTKPNGSKFVEKVGGPSFGARIKNNLKKTLASLRSFLDKAVQLMKKLVNIALYLRIRHTTEEYGLRVQTEEAHIRR
ncbi:MAG: hypothetical protein LBI29_01140, partial [Rickettsiales bacterium]|jgi:hypothetical protein|nr:hypothetical protein [Rickettsiales bacterium]